MIPRTLGRIAKGIVPNPVYVRIMEETPCQLSEASLHWYALWVYRSLVAPVVAICDREGVQTYRPMRIVEHFTDAGKTYEEEPLVSNLLFVRTTEEYVHHLKRVTKNRGSAYCYPGTDQPAAVPDKEMEVFMLVARVGGRRLESVEIPIDKGDKVRVTEGMFKGAEGYIRRVHGTKRLVVAIEGVVAVAVTHIPRQFLERIASAGATGIEI